MTDPNADMWAWAHEQHVEPAVVVDSSGVLAILVAHNGAQWLPRTLVGLARLDAQPGMLVVVDAGSTDDTRTLLDKGVADGLIDLVVDGDARAGFGANVKLAIQAASSTITPTHYWFLHDDSAPEPTTLTQLLNGAETPDEAGRKPGIVVPKLLHPRRRNHPDQMSAVGESIAPSGARVLTIEPGDIDQHQVGAAPVLGASTAGLLVTAGTWRTLGGFDDQIVLFRDGVDLGWRANEVGILVRTWPKASLRHVEAGRVGLRTQALCKDSRSLDARMGMMVVAKHSENPGHVIRRMRRKSFGQAIGFLLGKSPSMARGQLRATARLVADREKIIAAAAKTSHSAVPATLLPGRGWELRHLADRWAGRISDSYYDLIEDEDSSGMLDELTGDEYATTQQQSRIVSPALAGLVIMLIGTLIAMRSLLHTGFLVGPGLLPAPATLGDAWGAWATSANGLPGANAPWLGVMAVFSTLFLGHPDWFATFLVCGGPALASWTAFRFLRSLSGPGWWTPVLAIAYGVWLPLMGATALGSLHLSMLGIMLPVIAGWIISWATQRARGPERWRRPAKLAGGFALLAVAMPWTWAIAIIVAVVVMIRRRTAAALLEGLLVIIVPPVVLVPWLPRLIADPGRLFTGTDPVSMPASAAHSGLWVLTGASQAGGTPVIMGAVGVIVLLLAAALGAVRSRDLDGLAKWTLVLLAMMAPAAAVGVTRFVVPVAGILVRLDPVPWLLTWGFAMISLVAAGMGHRKDRTIDDSDKDIDRNDQFNRSRIVLGALALVVAVIGVCWWMTGAMATLQRQDEVLPSYVAGVQDSERRTRTLMVDLSSGIAAVNVASDTQPAWGSAEVPMMAASASGALDQVAQQFAQGQPADDLADRLADLGVGHVWLRGASPQAVTELSTSPGLGQAVVDDNTVVFIVTSQPSRWNWDRDRLVLAEPVDPAWQASIDGNKLERVDSGDWRVAWDAGSARGEIRFWATPDVGWIIWEIVVSMGLVVLMAPSAQRVAAPRRALGGTR